MTSPMTEVDDNQALMDLLNLDMEFRLTIAHRINCWCSEYLAERRDVLLPQVLKMAKEKDEDPVDFFHAFSLKLHAEKCNTPTTGRIAALFAAISEMGDEDV